MRAEKVGYDPKNLAIARIPVTGKTYASTAHLWDFERWVLEPLAAQPGVLSAAMVSSPPLGTGLREK